MTPFPCSICLLLKSKHLSCQAPETNRIQNWLQNSPFTVSTSVFPPPFPNMLLCPAALLINSTSRFLSLFFWCIISSPSVALSSYLKLTAPVPASSTSWCPQFSRPSPPSQRRSAPFLPRGSAPSAHARIAWLTAARSEKKGSMAVLRSCEWTILTCSSCFFVFQITSELVSPPPSPTR